MINRDAPYGLARIFMRRPTRRPAGGGGRGSRRRLARGAGRSPRLEQLEARQLLAVDLFQYPIAGVTEGESSYAVLLMNEGVSGFLKKNATPSPSFTYADNSQFLDDPSTLQPESITFAEIPARLGPLQSFYVTSGERKTYAGSPLDATTYGTLGPTTTFFNFDPFGGPAPIDVGTGDGIVPGTFLALLSSVDNAGNAATAWLLNSNPGSFWNLTIERTEGSGDGELPSVGRVDAFGNVTLRGWSDVPQSVNLTPVSWGVYTDESTDPDPLSFTLFAGQTVAQRLLVDLSRSESTITINSPVTATLGNSGDPAFFSGAGGVAGQVGQVVLDGSTIVTNANVSSSSLFTVGVPMWSYPVSTRIPVQDVAINRPLAAPRHQLIVEATSGSPGRLLVGEQGSLAASLTAPSTKAAVSLDIQAKHADVVFAGVVNAAEQTYLLQSPVDPRAYSLTTVSPTSGVQSGRILGDTVGVTLANDAGGEFDVRTTIDNLRLTAATTPASPVLPYAIRVLESDDLVVDAVPASRREIEITAAGTLTLQSSIETSGSLTLSSQKALTLSSPISSATGNVSLVSDSVSSNSPVTAGGTRGVTLTSLSPTGNVDVNALVRAGGAVKQPVRAATTGNVNLATVGLTGTVDGIAVAAGDRVLVKNQTVASQNGIYVVSSGAWTRAADSNASGQFSPGFSVFVSEGSQMGGWTFANPANPSLGTTGLIFVPTSATQTYAHVKAATTANVDLATGGLLTIDDIALVAGDRVLVKNQTNNRQNGIYVVSAGPWQRASDADTASELRAGSYVFVAAGTTNGLKGFVLNDDAVQVGVTELTFSAFAVQATRTNVYSPANVLPSAVAATTVSIDLAVAHTTIDGQSLATGDRVLVKNQVNAAENGVYEVQGDGTLLRSSVANDPAELARGTTVYVTGGAVNAATSWTFNDSTGLLGSITAGTQTVAGLASTARLSIGMLVTGPGIPAGTTITGIIGDTSIRLSKLASVTDPVAVLTFTSVSPIEVDTTPIVFVPTGGAVVVTAGQSITSSAATPSSRLQGSSALLSAGRPASGTAAATAGITANTNVGLLSAAAPAAITIDNANELNLVGVGTSTAGAITVTASGTLTASSVAATGSAGSPGNVTLLSTFGNVVAAEVASTLGVIDLTASRGDVRITAVKSYAGGIPFAANVTARDGSVSITANESPGSTAGNIRVDGRLVADGAAGDILLKTSTGSLLFSPTAFVNAKDQLLIDTPQALVGVDAGAQVAGSRLSLTAQLGKGTSPPPALGSYQAVFINRTDAGDIDSSTAGSLTVEGAITKDGSIAFTAPDITVTGVILPNGTAKEISLLANAGDLRVDAPLTASGAISVRAPAGKISSSAGTATPLITTPLSLVVDAATQAKLTTKVASLDALLTESDAILEVAEADSLVIERVLLSAGGTADLKVGSPTLGGSATVKFIDVGGASGTLKLVANENIVDAGTPAVADIVANRAELTATTGKIDVDTDVNVLLASATQKNQTITVDDLGASGLELQSVATNNADISVTAKGTILATSVTTAGRISLAATEAEADIVVNSLTASGNTISLAARRSILEATPGDAAADITATTVTLSATDGSIDAHVNASAVAATAKGAGATIRIRDDNDLSVGDGKSGIDGVAVTFTIGGTLTQTRPIEAASLRVEPTAAGGDVGVKLDGAGNKVQSLTILGGTKTVSFTNAVDLGVAMLTGGSVSLRAAGTISQPDPTGSIKAATLFAEATAAGDVLLLNPANAVGALTGKTASGSLRFVNGGGFKVGAGGIVAGTVAGGDGDISLTAASGDLEVAGSLTASSDRITLATPEGTITQTAGTITAGILDWTAKTVPAFTSLAVGALGANLTGAGDLVIGKADQPLTVASAKTADGSVTILGSDVTIDGLVTVGGAGKTAAVNAAGFLLFQNEGRIENLDAAGSVALTSGTTLTATNQAAWTSVTAGDSLTIAAGDATTLKTDVKSLLATVAAGGLTITGASELALSGITAAGQSVSLVAAGGITQTGPIAASSLSASNTSGSIVLTDSANDVGSFTAAAPHAGGDVLFLNKRGFTVVPPGIVAGTPATDDGRVELTAASGNLAVSSDITAIEDVVRLVAPGGIVTIDPGVTIAARELVISDSTVVKITSVTDDVLPATDVVTDGGWTNDATPTIVGVTGPGSTVTVSLDGIPIAPSVVADSSGNWSLTTGTLADGTYAITARATNPAGDTGSPSAAYVITVDTLAPAAATITAVTDDVDPVVGDVADGGSTNDTVLVLAGTTESGTAVAIFNGATKLGDATVTGTNWSFTTASLANGTTYVFRAVATDRAGNVGADSATRTVTIDTTPPPAPAITGALDDEPLFIGNVPSGGTTNDSTLVLSGTTAAGTTVEVFDGATKLGDATVTGTTWSFVTAALASGTTYFFTARATDAAGNPSTVSAAYTVTVDTAPPVAPAITSVTDDVPLITGPVANGGVTNDTVLVLAGMTASGTTVEIFNGPTKLGNATVIGTSWSFATPTLANGVTYAFVARAADLAGNTTSSAAHTVTIDTTPPAAPTITAVADNVAPVVGNVANGGSTNDTVLVLSGTTASGTTVEIFSGATKLGDATVTATTWSFTTATLANGVTYVFTARAADSAGNTTSSAAHTVTIDTTPPAAPTITSVTDDVPLVTGAVANGGVTNDTTPTISGVAEPGSTVTVLLGGSAITPVAVANGSGNWSITTAALGDGTYAITARTTDAAGNVGPDSAPYTVTIDTASPPAPAITGSGDDVTPVTGNVPSGGATNDTTPTFTGTAEPGLLITVLRGDSPIGSVTADGSGRWTLTTPVLPVGTHTFTATASNAAGNTSVASAGYVVTVDTAAPPAPVITSVIDDRPNFVGVVANGGATNDNEPQIVGTAEPGAIVTVRSGSTVVGTATADGSGNWSLTTSRLADRRYTFTATAADAAGNTSAASSPAYAVTVDTVKPARAAITSVIDDVGTITGSVPFGGRTDDTTLLVRGTAEPNSLVVVRSEKTILRRVTADAFGNWSVTTPVLAAEVHKLNAYARDAADNVGLKSPNHTVTVDTTAPRILSLGTTQAPGTFGPGTEIPIHADASERLLAGSAIDVTLSTGAVVRLAAATAGSRLTGVYRVIAGPSASPLSIVAVANATPIARDIAGNPVSSLPAVPFVLGGVNIDATLAAFVTGFSSDPAVPTITSAPVTSIQIVFSTEVTGVSLAALRLIYNQRETISLRGATITGSGRTYTLTMPANLTNRLGSYRLVIGPSSAIRAVEGNAPMDLETNVYWNRV